MTLDEICLEPCVSLRGMEGRSEGNKLADPASNLIPVALERALKKIDHCNRTTAAVGNKRHLLTGKFPLQPGQ